VASHDYYPCGYIARGREEIARYLDECEKALREIWRLTRKYPMLNDEQIAQKYNSTGELPLLGAHVVAALRGIEFAEKV